MFWLNLIKRVNIKRMPKRITIFATVILLALVVIVGFIFIQHRSGSVSNPLRAIPTDVSLVIQVNDFHGLATNLIEKNKVFNSLKTISPFNEICNTIRYIDSLALVVDDLSGYLFRSRIYISSHFIGGRKTEFLFLIEHIQGKNEKHAIDILSDITGQAVKKTERKYEGKSIYSLSINKESPVTYYISIIEGNVLLSKSVILIENAIRQYSLPNSLLTDKEFVEVVSTAGRSKEANLFIDLRRFNGMISILANDEYHKIVKEYTSFGGWMELDLNTTEKQIFLNGFITSGDQQKSFSTIFSGNDPVNISVDKILPASVFSFLSIGAEDIKKLYDQYVLYLREEGTYESRKNRLAEFEKKYKISLEDIFLSLIGDEVTLAYGGIKEGTLNDPSIYVLLKCKSGTQTEKSVREMINRMGTKTGRLYTQLISTYVLDADTKFTLVEFPVDNITGILFGDLFSIPNKNYYTIIGNYMVFADSKTALGEFIHSNVLSKTLSTNESYKAFNSNIAQNSFMLFYANLSRASLVFSSILHPDIVDTWEKNHEIFQRIQPLGMQITEVSTMNYCNFSVQYLDYFKGKPQTIWESLLDTSFVCKPHLVENHYTKQKEIFIQDLANTIYLINKAGRILWKQKITEPINSKVFQIDYYKNGKLQLLFSTDNYLHLIDRNGNYVERYPVRLRERATAGLALFDYENNRNYRIFIPCADNKIYAYTKDGSLINGWTFPGTDYPVNHPVEHFRVEDKDFIVLGDKYATYILDRRGNIRVPVNKPVAKSKNNTYYLDEKGSLAKSRIVTTDTAGNIVAIDFNGNIDIISLGKYSNNHFFDFEDVNSDGQEDYIILDGNILVAYTGNKTEILNFSFANDITLPPIYFNFSYSDRKLGVVDNMEGKIYLINQDGSLYKGFPLQGSTLFSIGYLENQGGVFDLIVGGRNNFLYNYTVQ